MTFAENLAALPAIDQLAAIALYADGLHGQSLVARIDNQPGSAGSVRVYHALFLEFGAINRQAAQRGLTLYAEHTADAQAFPGKHPNIDRLLALLSTPDTVLQVKLIAA